MRILVIYDTLYGNTKHIAETIAAELGVKAEPITSFSPSNLSKVDLLIVGSPINGWKPSERMENFLNHLADNQLYGTHIAAFDTRVKLCIHGDAANKIAHTLEKVGGKSIVPPKGFIVAGTKGPLEQGEKEKAKKWAQQIKEASL